MKKWWLYILMCSVSYAYAQDASIFKPDSVQKEIAAVKISNTLKINGHLNEEDWKLAKPSPQFTQIEPYQGKKPSHETQVKVLYNQKFLYFGIISRDSLGKKAIRATDFKRDFNFMQHDLVTLSFDGFNDKRNAMAFATNAYGVQRDLLSFDDLYYDVDWDGLWRVRTSRSDSGWVAEIAIPWQTLRYPKKTIQNWGFNIYRNRRLTNEITALSPFPRSFSSLRMNYAGILTNLQPPPPRPNIRIQPYFLTSNDQYKNFDPSFKPGNTNYKVGGEVKWAINTHSILDLTFNTDFAQADADRQVNNVTRFSVLFPERRQFFLENSSLFGAGVARSNDGSGGSMVIQPFFSRTIGLDDIGNPIPIDFGGRFVHRSAKSNYGVIAMRQRGNETTPATNFFVGRYSKNFGLQNRIGGLVTLKNRPDGTSITSALDGFFRLGQSHSLNAMAIYSTSTSTGLQGFSGFTQYQYLTNQTKIWWTESVVTKDFKPEMGFVSRYDVIGTTPGINWYYRGNRLPFKKVIRAFEPGFLPEIYHQASTGKLIEMQLPLFPFWLNLQNGGFLGYAVNPTYQQLTETFTPLGISIPVGEYSYMRQSIWASTDPSKKINLFGTYEWGSYFDGYLGTHDWRLQIAPIPHFSILGRFNRNDFIEVGETNTTSTIDYYSVESRFAWNPRIQLIGFYQKNSQNNSDNYNIRLSLEYKPLSYIYVVFNHHSFDNLNSPQVKQVEDHSIAKISYLKQF